jgi:hypothetical protein
MKHVPLTQGKVAIVDDADFEWLSQWKWFAAYLPAHNSYVAQRSFRLDGQVHTVRMSRAILGLDPGDTRIVQPANGNWLDCRRANLIVKPHREIRRKPQMESIA